MSSVILKDDLYSEYQQKWYDDSDPKKGFGLSEKQIRKLERKYELWCHLHPNIDRPENRCTICRKRRGKEFLTCPSVLLVQDAPSGPGHSFRLHSKDEWARGLHWCMEWVKYV